FCAELKPHRFVQFCVLKEGNVPALQPGSPHCTAPSIARRSGGVRWIHERSGIEPLAESVRCSVIGIADLVRTSAGKAVAVEQTQSSGVNRATTCDRQGQPCIGVDDARNFPTTQEVPCKSGLGFVERKFVHIADVEDLSTIEGAFTSLRGQVIRILWRTKIALRVGDCVRISVVHGDQRISGKALLNTYLQGMVV